jgi:16S rRNA (cytosine967-C5)-methyltransferase
VTDKVNAREVVLDMLMEVIEGDRYSHKVLSNTLKNHQQLDKQERAFITRLFIGTVKVYLRLDYIVDQFSTIPTHKMKPFIRCLLRQGVYQILYMEQVPVSAACNEAVKLAKKRNFTKLSGFVNAILRNIARNVNTINYPDSSKNPIEYLSISYSFPKWLVSKIVEQYGFHSAQAMLASSLKEKETTIRCNEKKLSAVKLKAVLQEEGITVEDGLYLDYAFRIKNYDYLEKLDSFKQGFYAVQDVSSMLVCEVAGITEASLVLDVCSAPGGKSMHAAQVARKVIARDISDYKIGLIEENIRRLGYTNVETNVWDATKPDDTMIRQTDIVIADLPCSGLGVIGKKPDIKYKLTSEQLNELVILQRRILEIVQNYVKEGGVLIFCTCTVNKDENLGNREWFLHNFDFEADSIYDALPESLRSSEAKEGYLQLLQGIHDTDGFFISKFKKK